MSSVTKFFPLLGIMGVLCMVIGFFMVVTGASMYQSDTAPPTQPGNATSATPTTSHRAVEVIYSGSEDGLMLGDLPAGKTATVTYLGGKIITNSKTGYSSPIWGAPPSETDPYWLRRMPQKDMWNDAVYVQAGGQRVQFMKGQNSVTVKNDSWLSTPVWLMMNDAQHSDNYGDARFSFQVR